MGATARPLRKRRRSVHLGNRIWRVEGRDGPVVQKLYRERGGALRTAFRSVLARLIGRKTGPGAAARRRTERDTLAVWRDAGFDVPADLTAAHPEYAADRVLVLEDAPGPTLADVLGSQCPPERRVALLARFAEAWGRRHRAALDGGDARLVQEHGTFAHVIVSGDRLVTIDLEQAFLRHCDPRPLVAKEMVGYLSSLRKRVDESTFRADLETLVGAYPERDLLVDAVRAYTRPTSIVTRIVQRLERALQPGRSHVLRKYEVVRLLDAALRSPEG